MTVAAARGRHGEDARAGAGAGAMLRSPVPRLPPRPPPHRVHVCEAEVPRFVASFTSGFLNWQHTVEKSLPFLFKRYMQASTDHARKYGGTGLGPAICKQLDVHMPEMDCLQATRLIRLFENTGYWEAFVNPEDNPMLAN